MMLFKLAFLFATLQGTGAPARYVDLAAAPPPDVPIREFSVKGCVRAFDDPTPKPPDFCYPFPVRVRITAYDAGVGYTKASLVVEVTNSGKTEITLPVGLDVKPGWNEAGRLSLVIDSSQDETWSVGSGFTYSAAGDPSSFATMQPGESIAFEIPIDVKALKRVPHRAPGTEVPVVVKLGFSKLQKKSSGEWKSMTDTNPVPSNEFSIPSPD